jgi:hypothetical protein
MKYNTFFFVALVLVLLPATSHAGEFVNLVGVPGLSGDPTNGGLNDYINALYRLSISIAALLAVIKIVIAGAKYMLSDIVTHKEDAKKDIQGALIGLLIVIGAIIILNTINTDLTDLDLAIDQVEIEQGMTIQEYIAERQRSMDERAQAAQTTPMIYTCAGLLRTQPDIRDGETNEQACSRVCRETLRGVYDYNYLDQSTCNYNDSEAQQCNPNVSEVCCETVKNGDWNSTTNSCGGLTEATEERKLECGRDGRVWDEAGDYCRTASCNINTDANCCTAQTGGSIINNVCNTATGNSIGTPIDSNDVIGSQVTPIAMIESSLGLGAGGIGDTELEQISLYLEGTIDREQLESSLGTTISNISTLNTLAEQLSCGGGGNNGDTVGYSRAGGNITFTCVNAIP